MKKILSKLSVQISLDEPQDSSLSVDELVHFSVSYQKSVEKMSFEELLVALMISQNFIDGEMTMKLPGDDNNQTQAYLERLRKLAAASNCPYKMEVALSLQ